MNAQATALIVHGGWEGHQPAEVGRIFSGILEREGFVVHLADSLEAFEDGDALKELDLIVPIWTMGEISPQQSENVSEAVADGTGLAGCHGGMCDAFRKDVLWQFMTGGNWVAHPGGDGVPHRIDIRNSSSPITAGMTDFDVSTEQYYLQVDPAIEVLATTRFPVEHWYHSSNGSVDVPQIWTKRWGVGRVFYNALGHQADVVRIPQVSELMRRGFLWAAEGKAIARREGLTADSFRSDKKMF